MSKNPHRPDNYGLVMALTIMLVVWLINSRGLLRPVDDFFSHLTGAHAANSFDPVELLLVYTDRATLEADDDRLVTLLRSIQDMRPTSIGIAHRLSAAQCQRVENSGLAAAVVMGTKVRDLQAVGAAHPHLPCGYVDLWIGDQPVYHWHQARIIGRQQNLESLEARLARMHQGTQARIPRGEFGIRYRGGASGLPHVDQTAFSDGSIVPELVTGRIVLMGLREEAELGLATPTTSGTNRMSRLEVHGNILNTILKQNSIAYGDPLLALGLLLAVTILGSHLFRQVTSDWIVLAGLAALLVIAVVAWFATYFWSVQLPLTAMWLACCLNFLGILRSRFHTLAKFFHDWKLLRRANLKTTRRQSYDEVWSSVASSAAQIFCPERIVVLELQTAATHLHVRALIGCETSDIVEKRRDISRSPFRDAFEQRCPIAIDFREFLSSRGEDKLQWMVPLIDGPEPQGVLVMEVCKADIENWADFTDRLSEFADEMAVYLAGLRERELERLLAKSTLHRIRFLPERIVSRALYQDEVEHRDYEELLNRAIDCSHVPEAIYDVFGRLLKSNKRMNTCLQDQDVLVTEASCAEMLAALTGHNEERCRDLVCRCLIEDRPEEIMLSPSRDHETARIIYITPLVSLDRVVAEGIEHRSVSIQIIDSGIFHDVQLWHKEFVASHTAALRTRMSQLQQLTQQLHGEQHDQELAPYWEIADEVAEALEQCQAALSAGIADRGEDRFATEIKPILTNAIEASQTECDVRGVQFDLCSDLSGVQVICNPPLLRQVFVSILERLLQDATRHSVISIAGKRHENRLRIRLNVVSQFESAAATELSGGSGRQLVSDGKAASVVLDPHAHWIRETEHLLELWDASLKMECGTNYQLSVELDLACQTSPGKSSDALLTSMAQLGAENA